MSHDNTIMVPHNKIPSIFGKSIFKVLMMKLAVKLPLSWISGCPLWKIFRPITKNINDKLEKVGDSNYTEFFGSINTWAWASSEFSSTHAVYIDSGVDEYKGPGSVRFYYGNLSDGYKTGRVPVRPFLAF